MTGSRPWHRVLVGSLLAYGLVGPAGSACDGREALTPFYLSSECLECTDDGGLERCSDSADNDEDGLTDCQDPDCAVAYVCTAVGPENVAQFCTDGFDNDGNGFTDCEDFGCTPTSACRTEVQEDENTPEACSDGLDNDWNGFIDCGDFSCGAASIPFCEGSDETCVDGIDNDGNGFTDCDDFACSRSSAVTVCQ